MDISQYLTRKVHTCMSKIQISLGKSVWPASPFPRSCWTRECEHMVSHCWLTCLFFSRPKTEADEKHQDVTSQWKKPFPIFHLEQGDVCGLRANQCSGSRSPKGIAILVILGWTSWRCSINKWTIMPRCVKKQNNYWCG